MQSGNDEAVVSLVVDASGLRQGSTEAVALGKRIIDGLAAIKSAADGAGAGISAAGVQIVKSLGDQNRFLNQVERSLNPYAAAANKAATELNRLVGIMEKGGEAGTRAAGLIEAQAQKVLTLKTAIESASSSTQVFNQLWSQAEQILNKAISGFSGLIAKFEPAVSSAQRMTGEIAALNAEFRQGLISEEQYASMNSKIVNSYNEGAVAAQKLLETRAMLIAQARESQNASTAQLGIQQVTGPTAGSDFARDLRLQMEGEQELVVAQEKVIQIQEAAMASSKKLTQQAQIDTYNRGQALKLEIAQLQIRAEAENKAFDLKIVKDAADRLDYLTNKYNQDARAAKNYQQTILELNEALSKGAIGFNELGLETGRAIDIYNRSTVAGQALAKQNVATTQTHKDLTNATFLNRVGAMEFQAAIINSFQAVASGMNVTHVAMMEGAQVFGAVVQGTNQGFGIIKTAALAIISPIGLAVTALGVLAAGFALVVIRAISNENQLRRFDTQLGAITQTSVTSSIGLQKLSFDLRAIGVAAADAEKGIISLGQNLNVNSQGNSGAISTLSNLSLNVGARLGIGDAAGFTKVNEAINGQIAGVIKLGLETRSLTTDEVKIAQTEALHGNQIQAINNLLKIMDDRLAGVHKKSMDDATQGVHSLTGEWNNLLNKLADLVAWKQIEDATKNLLTQIGNLATALKTGDFKFNIRINWLGPFGDMTTEQFTTWLKSLLPEQSDMAKRAQANYQNQQNGGIPSANGSTLSVVGITPGYTVSSGGGVGLPNLQRANIQGKDIGDLNSVLASRLDAYFAEFSDVFIQSATRFGAHPSRFNAGGTGLHNADILGQGMAVDLGNLYPAAARGLTRYGLAQNTTSIGDFSHVELAEIPSTAVATGAARMVAARKFLAGLGGGTSAPVPLANVPSFDLGGNPISATAPGFSNQGMGSNLFAKLGVVSDPKVVTEAADAVAKYNEAVTKGDLVTADAIKNAKLFNIEQAASTAGTNVYRQAIDAGRTDEEARNLAAQEYNKTLQVGQIELGKTIESQQIQIKGDNQVADALKGGVEAMIQQDAKTKAILESRQTGISVEEAYKKALAEGAATAVKGAAEATVALTPEIAAQERLSVAFGKSAAAGHEAEIQNTAIAVTQKALDAANAAGLPVDKARVENLLSENLAKQKKLDLDKQIVALKQQDIQSANEIQTLQLTIGLQGQTSEEIARQVSLLQAKQDLEARGVPVTDAEYQKRLQMVDAVGRMKIALDDAQRAQQRLEDGLKQMAETIGTTLVTALAGLFDKSKVTDWSATIKSALTSIGSSLLQSTLIKPLTGSIFSALGFGNLAQQFGTLSGSTADSSNSLTGSTTSSGGIFDIFKNIGGAGKSIFDLFSGSSSSSGGGFLSGLFGSGASAATTGGAFGLGDFGGGGAALGVSDALGLGVGAGEGLGALSGIGSALGSIIPFAGPVIGLASMFLGGLFNKKPANNVSTGGIDLSGGGSIVSNPFSSGNAQNDAQAKQITDSISSFTKNLLKETGGAISGNIDVQAGTRDGIKIGGTIGSVATGLVGVVKFSDAASAISATTLAIAQHLEGVSDTMKKVLGQLTDPNQIESAIQFVNVYDKLDKAFKDSTVSVDAADAAFNSIATDAKAIGPFATAMGQITTLFQGLTDQANQFGLSLEPINFGLAEATKRLQGDFKTALDQSFNQVSGNDFLNQLNAARQTLLANQNEAGAIGLNLDTATQDKINAIYNTTITNILKGLNVDQLAIVANDVTDSWSVADSSINSFAKSLMQGSAVVAQFGAGIQSLKDLVTNLTSGTLSGIPIGQQITAEQGIFGNELNQVNAGNFNELGNLATAGGNVVSLAQTAFGNAPQTAAIRASVLSNVNQVLSSRSFASGTDNTPPGMILVGEDGPEWMSQSGGNKIYPMGMGGMGSIEGLRAEIVRLGQIVQNGVAVNREGFSQSVNHLGKIKENTESAKALQPAQRRAS